jgi:O-antigen ligase
VDGFIKHIDKDTPSIKRTVAMHYTINQSVDRLASIANFLAKFSFSAYLFFVFFGTTIPFTQEITDVEDIMTSNPINQYGFSILYVLSSLNLVLKRNQVIKVIKREKFLCLFILWSFLTILWSDAPFVSLKRCVQILGGSMIFLSGLLNFKSSDETFKYFKLILFFYIPATYLAILIMPYARHSAGAWKGLTTQKNLLGQMALISLIVWSYYLKGGNIKTKAVPLCYWILSFVLLMGSRSVTSILTAMMLVALIGALYLDRAIFRQLIGGFFSLTFFGSFFLCIFGILILYPELQKAFFGLFGKDLTFTGRTELWLRIFDETKKYFLYGCGFGGFWVMSLPTLNLIYEEFMWLPNQSHLGYLDVLNETGFIGFSLFALMIIYYFRNISKLNKLHYFKWIIFAALIINFSESTLFIPKAVTGTLFLFSYLALYVDHLREHQAYLSDTEPAAHHYETFYD